MNLNKCDRCGCFFASADSVCPNCQSKDENDIAQLQAFLIENDDKITVEDLAVSTGVTLKNVNRFLKNDSISTSFEKMGLMTNRNISVDL